MAQTVQTIRHYWGPVQGRVQFNYNWPSINWDSVVLISASEYVKQNPSSDDYRFIGASSITVENIAPHGPPYDSNHGVTFIVNVDWSSPLNIVTDITLLPPPIEIDYPSSTIQASVTPLASTTTKATANQATANQVSTTSTVVHGQTTGAK